MTTPAHEWREQVLEEMNARRIDHKTYIDSEWLLKEYEKTLLDQHSAHLVERISKMIKENTGKNRYRDGETAFDIVQDIKALDQAIDIVKITK
jgi:ribosomal protein S18 acetylase RimI-like enzyme